MKIARPLLKYGRLKTKLTGNRDFVCFTADVGAALTNSITGWLHHQ